MYNFVRILALCQNKHCYYMFVFRVLWSGHRRWFVAIHGFRNGLWYNSTLSDHLLHLSIDHDHPFFLYHAHWQNLLISLPDFFRKEGPSNSPESLPGGMIARNKLQLEVNSWNPSPNPIFRPQPYPMLNHPSIVPNTPSTPSSTPPTPAETFFPI